jgi:hypothetical protein
MKALAASMSLTPAKATSLGRRSCKVRKARSDRPLSLSTGRLRRISPGYARFPIAQAPGRTWVAAPEATFPSASGV